LASSDHIRSDNELWNGPVPQVAWVLGIAGLLPFVAGAAGYIEPDIPFAEILKAGLIPYAVIILPFMGAVHWGLAMAPGRPEGIVPRHWHYVVSVLPAIWTWIALVVSPLEIGLAMSLGFAGLLGFDVFMARRGLAPRWYPTLRVPLTLVVLVCLPVRAAFIV